MDEKRQVHVRVTAPDGEWTSYHEGRSFAVNESGRAFVLDGDEKVIAVHAEGQWASVAEVSTDG